MKRIERLSQLRQERQRLALRRIELEHRIRADWHDVRRFVAPATILHHVLSSGTEWIRQYWHNRKK